MNRGDDTKYCLYHCIVVHIMDSCQALKDEEEDLIQNGKLQEYVKNPNRKLQQQVPYDQGDQKDGKTLRFE